MGRRAVELLLAQLDGEEVPEQTIVPCKLLARQSCGCWSVAVRQARVEDARTGDREVEISFEEQRAHVLPRMMEAMADDTAGLSAGIRTDHQSGFAMLYIPFM